MRFYPALLLPLLLAAFPTGALAAPKHHHHSTAATAKHLSSAEKARHLTRLAAREKAAWRVHLRKVRELPHAAQLALKRHDRHVKRLQAKAHAPVSARPRRMASRMAAPRRAPAVSTATHQARLAHIREHHAQAIAAHQASLVRQQAAHREAESRHQEALAAAEARDKEALANAEARHQAALEAHTVRAAKAEAAVQARIAREQAAHNARMARAAVLHGESGTSYLRFWQTVVAGVPVKVISVDLNNPNVKVSAVMSERGAGTDEPFPQMIARANPNVAVTGTFFSLDNRKPVGDIVIDGSLVHFGGMGTALCITPDNKAEMVTCQWGRHHDWSRYDFVCACGPRLLEGGRLSLNPSAERFRDKHMLAPNSRIAVGITSGNTIFFAMTKKPISLSRLAQAMQALGASEAMNLDAGTSTGFYYNGATLARPGRKLTNMIVVYSKKDRYERALAQLVPSAYHRRPARYAPATEHAPSLTGPWYGTGGN